MEKPAVLKAKGLTKTFRYPNQLTLLKGVDLEVQSGESVAIMGRSGEGKSTLLQVLGTLEPPTTGSLEIAGQIPAFFNRSAIRSRHLGFIFQSFHLLEDYTVLENVLLPSRIARVNVDLNSPTRNYAIELLEEMGLKDRLNYSVKLLSGGEKQRVGIARALCRKPDLILADEPSGNLDKQTASHIHDLLISFSQRLNSALIVVTHDPVLAALCQKRYDLRDGQLEQIHPL